jgi:hypothetical protein
MYRYERFNVEYHIDPSIGKGMPDVTSHYIVRAKSVVVVQYESLRSALDKVMQHSGWVVHQHSFVAGVRSLNEAEFKENLEYFRFPP